MTRGIFLEGMGVEMLRVQGLLVIALAAVGLPAGLPPRLPEVTPVRD